VGTGKNSSENAEDLLRERRLSTLQFFLLNKLADLKIAKGEVNLLFRAGRKKIPSRRDGEASSGKLAFSSRLYQRSSRFSVLKQNNNSYSLQKAHLKYKNKPFCSLKTRKTANLYIYVPQ
jgi:hypothetical protein